MLKPLQGSNDSESSPHRAVTQEMVNQERADLAKTLSRKRKQSEDHSVGVPRRSLSVGPLDGLPEGTEIKNGKPDHIPEGKARHRALLDDMGLEGALKEPRVEASHSLDSAGKRWVEEHQ